MQKNIGGAGIRILTQTIFLAIRSPTSCARF